MICVDSSVWINYFNGKITRETNLLDSILGKELVVVGDLIYTEVLQGFRSDRDFLRAKDLFSLLSYRDMVGREVSVESAKNYRTLRRRGVQVKKTIDMIIATFCLVNDLHLLHADNDFNPMVKYLGLQVI